MNIYPPHPEYPVSEDVVASIHGYQMVIDHLGHWPSFHDMEVVRLNFDRLEQLPGVDHDLLATFYIFDLTKSPADPERKPALLEILFNGVTNVEMQGWSHQNPILGLSLQRFHDPNLASYRTHVFWGGCNHEVKFACDSISVVRLRELNPFREAKA